MKDSFLVHGNTATTIITLSTTNPTHTHTYISIKNKNAKPKPKTNPYATLNKDAKYSKRREASDFNPTYYRH